MKLKIFYLTIFSLLFLFPEASDGLTLRVVHDWSQVYIRNTCKERGTCSTSNISLSVIETGSSENWALWVSTSCSTSSALGLTVSIRRTGEGKGTERVKGRMQSTPVDSDYQLLCTGRGARFAIPFEVIIQPLSGRVLPGRHDLKINFLLEAR